MAVRLAVDGRKGLLAMADSEHPAPRSISLTRRVVKGVAIAAGSIVVGAAALVVGAAAVVARRVVVPDPHSDEDIRVLGVDLESRPATITMEVTPHSVLGGNPGEYSLWFADGAGHVVVGEIVGRDEKTVTRAVVRRGFGDVQSTHRARMNGWLWMSPADAEVTSSPVAVEAPHGLNPAWLLPGGRNASTWAIHIHGHGSKRAETLRSAISLLPWEFTQLVASYRNDGEGERSEDGRYALGDTEWQDIDAAIAFALSNGAERVLLVGWSMGGAIALQTAERSPYSGVIAGLILDSPAVDWVDVLRYQGEAMGLPSPVRRLTLGMIGTSAGRPITGQRVPVDFSHLRWPARAENLTVPVVLLHSDDDGLVPPGPSREFAAARPDLVTFVPFTEALHCRLWNFDRPRWESAVNDWLYAQGFTRD